MKSINKSIISLLFVTLIVTSMFTVIPVKAGKKKMLAALLIGAALAAKPKILPIPLPIPIPIKKEEKKYVPYPQPYPVYVNHGYGGGYEDGYGYDGGYY